MSGGRVLAKPELCIPSVQPGRLLKRLVMWYERQCRRQLINVNRDRHNLGMDAQAFRLAKLPHRQAPLSPTCGMPIAPHFFRSIKPSSARGHRKNEDGAYDVCFMKRSLMLSIGCNRSLGPPVDDFRSRSVGNPIILCNFPDQMPGTTENSLPFDLSSHITGQCAAAVVVENAKTTTLIVSFIRLAAPVAG